MPLACSSCGTCQSDVPSIRAPLDGLLFLLKQGNTLPDGPSSLLPFTGGLDLAIEGPSKAEISCIDNKDGTCTVTYLPTLPGDYSILVKYNDKHIPGSPFTAKITGTVAWLTGGILVGGMAAPTALLPLRPGPAG